MIDYNTHYPHGAFTIFILPFDGSFHNGITPQCEIIIIQSTQMSKISFHDLMNALME